MRLLCWPALKADANAQRGDVERSADVVVDATRHIVSTTATTIGGFVPLILFGGTFLATIGHRHCWWRCRLGHLGLVYGARGLPANDKAGFYGQ